MSAVLLAALTLAAPPADVRDPWLWPFAADSIWNTRVGSGATYVRAGIGKAARVGVDVEHLYRVPPGSPARPVFAPKSWDTRAGGTLRLGDLPVPDDLIVPDARKGSTPNNCAAFLLPDGRTVAGVGPLCQPEPGGPVYGYVFDKTDLWGDGIAGSHGGSRMSVLGGSIRLGELTSYGPIRHALKVDVFCKKYAYFGENRRGYRWPASAADAYAAKTYGGKNPAVVMGSLLAVPPGVTAETLGLKTAVGRKLHRALQDCGAYLVDDAAWDCHYLCAEAGVREEVERATGLKLEGDAGDLVADVNALFAALAVVDNNGPTAVGVGGEPRATKAPPLPDKPAPNPPATPPAPFPTNGAMTAGKDVPDGWGNKWEGRGKLTLSRYTTTFKTGPAALAVCTAGGPAQGQAQQAHDARPGATVRFAGYLKTSGSLTVTVGVMAYTADWKGLSFQAIDQAKGTSDWRPFVGTVTLPPNTAHFAYTLMVDGEGTAWLDEVAGDAAAYQAVADETKKALPRVPAAPKVAAPPKAPNAWTAGEGIYPDYPTAWRKTHEGMVERAKKGGIDLVFFGDSITQGWNDQKELWAKYYAPRKAANFGIGGDGTPQVLWRLDHGAVDGLKPKAVVLMIGTNNRWRGDATPESVAKGIGAILAKLKEKVSGAKVLVLGVFPTQPKPDHPDRKLFAEANKKLAALADGKRVFFLDLTDKVLEPDGTITKEMMPDYLHLSAKGYRIWAEAMEPTLKQVLGE